MVEDLKTQNKKTKKKRKKCHHCKKKLSIINYSCRCNKIFCPNCRLPEEHKCSFDIKNYLRQKLAKTLIKVVPDKIKNRID